MNSMVQARWSMYYMNIIRIFGFDKQVEAVNGPTMGLYFILTLIQ